MRRRYRHKNPPCFLCRRVHGRYWIHAADYVAGVAELRGIGVCLCTRCWFRKGVLDMSFYRDVEQKLCEIFASGWKDVEVKEGEE